MLKLRVLTALVLAPLAVWGTLALPSQWFAGVLGGIFCLAAWEWSRLAGLSHVVMRHLYVAMFVCLLIVLLGAETLYRTMVPLAAVATVWWGVALLFILSYPRGSGVWTSHPSTVSFAGVLSLLPGWVALAGLHWHVGKGYALLLLLLVWGADVGTYFAGRLFGNKKLAPQVSPGKTWAGVWGAMAVTVLVAIGGAAMLQLPTREWPILVVISLVTVAASIVGDLTESMFKRLSGVKDSGGILPGHGGILDRIDSLVAAAPVFVLGLLWRALL